MPKIPKWLKKSFVTLVTVVTLGTIVPSIGYLTEQRPSSEEGFNGASTDAQGSELAADLPAVDHVEEESDNVSDLLPHLQSYALEEAKVQGFLKFGDTITEQIGETYTKDILPKFADAVAELGKDADIDRLKNIAITNNPSGGMGERILNIYDRRNGKELLKLHVRRDHPPLEGYWFNFHYHIYEDHHQVHHELGKIYWDKNTPPQWRA